MLSNNLMVYICQPNICLLSFFSLIFVFPWVINQEQRSLFDKKVFKIIKRYKPLDNRVDIIKWSPLITIITAGAKMQNSSEKINIKYLFAALKRARNFQVKRFNIRNMYLLLGQLDTGSLLRGNDKRARF